MNILFFDSIEKETYGGMEKWVRLTAAGMARRGHRVTVAGRPSSEFLRRVAATDENIRLFPLNVSGDFHPVTIARLRRFLSREHIDVMTVNFNKDIRLGGLAARLNGGTRVVWSVGLDITKNSPTHRYLTPKLLDGVIVPSQALKRQITRLGYINPDMVQVIPRARENTNSVPPKAQAAAALRKKYGIPEETVIAVTVGRLVEQKGHVYLIEAAAEIVAAFPKVVFLLLGDGPLRGRLMSRLKELNLTERFIFAGMVDDVDTYLAGADLMIHPSIEEPFGNALLEGMWAGLPIVASRVGGIPEVVVEGETALLVTPRDPHRLAEAVLRLLRSPSQRKALGQTGQQRCRTVFGLEAMLDRIETYLTGLVNAG
jgi:glycosyltransferase involved in cell wall biosynthesis